MIYVLDTNIITALMKNDKKVWEKLDEKIFRGENVFMNGISYYEIKRGLLAVRTDKKKSNKSKKENIFDWLCKKIGILFLDDQEIFDTASKIYARLKQEGNLIPDADILIAALVISRNMILVSDDSDFSRIEYMDVVNWLEKHLQR